MAQGPMHSCSW